MVPTYLIILILWIPQLGFLVQWLYWWQIKEYRFDRFKTFLATKQATSQLLIPLIVFKYLALALSIYSGNLTYYISALVIVAIYLSYFLLVRKLRKPIFTLRAKEIIATGLFSYIFLLGVLVSKNSSFYILLAEIYLVFALPLGIIWTSIFVNNTRNKERNLASEKIKAIKPVVVGVTGSYGKTTTKEFISHFTSIIGVTQKTVKNENTEFGVIRKINNGLDKLVRYFIVEMGAYKIGEINKIASLVNPSIGIITGIEPQHLSLFGSIENIMQAKYELIRNIKKDGIAIFNLSNAYCLEMAKWALKDGYKVYGYHIENKTKISFDGKVITAKILSATKEGTSFSISYSNEKYEFYAPVAGTHFVENITGALLVAHLLGAPWKDLQKAAKSLSTPENTMKVITTPSGYTLIDDSYNSTPSSFKSALNYLALFKAKEQKVLVSPGIIELGDMTDMIHRQIGEVIESTVNKAIFTNNDFAGSVSKGLNTKGKLVVVENPVKLKTLLAEFEPKKTVILIEGRVPEKIKKTILSL